MIAHSPVKSRVCLRALIGLALFVSAVACSSEPSASASNRPSGIPIHVDANQLRDVVAEVAAHPEWAPGPAVALTVRSAVTSLTALCIELERPPEDSLYLSVDPSATPWVVNSVVVFDPAVDIEPRITYQQPDYPDADLCRYVLAGSGMPFADTPDQIEVQGGLRDASDVPLIQQALFAEPHRFGVDRSSRTSINVAPVTSSGLPPELACYSAVVYQGGPRASVVFGLRQTNEQRTFDSVRVTAQVLNSPEPRVSGTC